MGLPYVCPKLKARVAGSAGNWYVTLYQGILCSFDNYSKAKTFAKRVNSMLRWLGPAAKVYTPDFGDVINDFLAKAGSGDGSYRPPLNLTS